MGPLLRGDVHNRWPEDKPQTRESSKTTSSFSQNSHQPPWPCCTRCGHRVKRPKKGPGVQGLLLISRVARKHYSKNGSCAVPSACSQSSAPCCEKMSSQLRVTEEKARGREGGRAPEETKWRDNRPLEDHRKMAWPWLVSTHLKNF